MEFSELFLGKKRLNSSFIFLELVCQHKNKLDLPFLHMEEMQMENLSECRRDFKEETDALMVIEMKKKGSLILIRYKYIHMSDPQSQGRIRMFLVILKSVFTLIMTYYAVCEDNSSFYQN